MSAPADAPDYRRASFVLSVARLAQCPPDEGIEVAFAGRSNAGKSSAINTICGQGKLARTSKTPGRTQQINFFALDDRRRLVDLPGYGFARIPEELRRAWGRLVESYLRERRSLAGIVLLMDVRHPLKDQDRDLVRWAATLSIPLHVLLTKSDKLARGAAKSTLLAVRRELATVPATTVQLFSALDGTGLDEARAHLDGWFTAPPAIGVGRTD